MKIISLFGGFEAGRMALDKLGIVPTEYYSAEVDKYAIKNASHNYPDIIHIGSVTEVDGTKYRNFDLLIGGSPCQDFSIAGKRLGFVSETYEEYLANLEKVKRGEPVIHPVTGQSVEKFRSELFWEYYRILRESEAVGFLLENVKGMGKRDYGIICRALGMEAMEINSSLLSAQNRRRLYWVGKRNEDGTYSKVEIPQPEDKGLVLRDILEDIPLTDERWKPLPEKYEEAVKAKIEKFKGERKSFGVTATYAGACPRDDIEKHNRTVLISQFRRSSIRIHADQNNSPTLTANMGTGENNVPIILGQYQLPHGTNTGGLRNPDKAQSVTANGQYVYNNQIVAEPYCLNPKVDGKQPSLADRIYHDEAKGTAVTTCFVTNVVKTPEYVWRKLTVRETARLQTFPEHYEFPVSASRAYKGIGNSWTVDVIAHIFRFMI